MTLRNWSGRFHATVNAQIAPLLVPPMTRFAGSVVSLYFLADLGKHLLDDEARVGVAHRVVLVGAIVRDCPSRSCRGTPRRADPA